MTVNALDGVSTVMSVSQEEWGGGHCRSWGKKEKTMFALFTRREY
jgi:hypothetical protein